MQLLHPVSDQLVYSEFLRAEWYKPWYDSVRSTYDQIVTKPDLGNTEHNQIRFDLLWRQKYPIVADIPKDTVWHMAAITPEEFGNLLVINEHTWRQTFGSTKLLKDVAAALPTLATQAQGVELEKIRLIQSHIADHQFDEKFIIMASDPTQTATILEGNHRAVAFQLHSTSTGQLAHIPTEIILGISPSLHTMQWANSLQ